MRCFVWASALVLALGWVAPAAAEPGVGQPITACIRPDPGGLSLAQVLAEPRKLDCSTPQYRFGRGDFWLVSGPLRARPNEGEHLLVRRSNVWQASETLYAIYADGAVARAEADQASVSRHTRVGAIVEHPLPVRHAPLVRLAWHIRGSENVRGILLGASLAGSQEAAKRTVMLAAIYAGFIGLSLALLVYNLAMWRALGHRFLRHYCSMVLGLLVYAMSSSAALSVFFPAIPGDLRLRINYLALAWAGAAALGFVRNFFGWEARWHRLRMVLRWIPVAVLVPAAAVAALGPWQLALFDRLFAYGFVALLLGLMPILAQAWLGRSNYLWIFALAWSAPLVAATLRALSSLHAIPYNFWIDNSTIIAMAWEAVVSSLAISYRIRLLSLERDDARARELAALLLADTDPLTGLLNRRAFLKRAIGRKERQQLILLDIDHFKRVNETIGHDGGDEVLRLVARVLRSAAPVSALIARIGGEEFAILVPEASRFAPETLLDGLRAARMPFDMEVTASIGACFGTIARENDWKLLYRCADLALFEAKAAGRDRARTAALPPTLAAAA